MSLKLNTYEFDLNIFSEFKGYTGSGLENYRTLLNNSLLFVKNVNERPLGILLTYLLEKGLVFIGTNMDPFVRSSV